MKCIPCKFAAIVVLIMAMPVVGDEPLASNSQRIDTAFDRIISRIALADAWASLDASGMTDGALQTLEAERVLGSPEPHLPASALFTLTSRLAMEQNDVESLSRLEKAVTLANRPELAAALTIAKKTAGTSRTGKNILPVLPENTNAPTFAAYLAFQHDITAARLCGDSRALDSIATDLENVSQFAQTVRENLTQQIQDARNETEGDTQVPAALDRLVSESRGIRWQGINTHWESPPESTSGFGHVYVSPTPKPVRPEERLGNERAGTPTNGKMSYEARQAALELLRNPNGIKPSSAKPTPNRKRP